MMPLFRLTHTARQRLVEIATYTQQHWGSAQRNTYLRALNRQFESIAHFPEKGRLRQELAPGLRSMVLGSHVIYYLQDNEGILIIDILHQRMDPERHLHS